jgi:hypothetical protein
LGANIHDVIFVAPKVHTSPRSIVSALERCVLITATIAWHPITRWMNTTESAQRIISLEGEQTLPCHSIAFRVEEALAVRVSAPCHVSELIGAPNAGTVFAFVTSAALTVPKTVLGEIISLQMLRPTEDTSRN